MYAGRLRAAQADVGDEQLGAKRPREHADRGIAARRRRGDLSAHPRREQADVLGGDAVIGREHEHADGREHARQASCDGGPALEQRLERAEAARGLDELVGRVADPHGGRVVGRDDRIREHAPPLRQRAASRSRRACGGC